MIVLLHVILVIGGNRGIIDRQFLPEVARQSILRLVVVLHDDIEGVKFRGCALFSLDERVVEHVVGEVLFVVHDVVAAFVGAPILLRVGPATAQLELLLEVGEAVGPIVALWPLILIILVGHCSIKVSAAHSTRIIRWPLAIRCMALILFLLQLLLLLLLG